MSINSALVKLADKIDVDGKSTISPEYKNPNNSIEKSIERIADNYNGSGGGGGTGGGVLVVSPNMDTGVLDKTWKEITDAPLAILKYTEDNITYQICPLSSYDEKAQGVYYNVKFKVNEQLSFTGSTDNPDGYPVLQ